MADYDLPKLLISENGADYDDANVMGYFVWSTMDNYEWGWGKQCKFGLIHVDFETQVRTPKESAYWYQRVIEENGVD